MKRWRAHSTRCCGRCCKLLAAAGGLASQHRPWIRGAATGEHAAPPAATLERVDDPGRGHLSVSFPGQNGPLRVVDDISFSVARGEMLGVVGESGSGKTMTSLAIAQLVPYPGRRGTVSIDGQDVRQLSRSARRRCSARGWRTSSRTRCRRSIRRSRSDAAHRRAGRARHLSQRQATAAALDGLKEVKMPIPSDSSSATRTSCLAGCASAS